MRPYTERKNYNNQYIDIFVRFRLEKFIVTIRMLIIKIPNSSYPQFNSLYLHSNRHILTINICMIGLFSIPYIYS